MISLIPSWAHHFDEFWTTLRKRNLWFIKLRFGAAVVLAAAVLSADFIMNLRFTAEQEKALYLIILSILTYNGLLTYIRRFIKCSADAFNPLHVSMIQMGFDLIALLLLCYYTGSIESPLSMLFIFHVIIGSMILPGRITYSFVITTVLVFTGIIYLEYSGIITHHAVNGLLKAPIYKNSAYIITYLSIFAFVLLMCVVITNRIANELYRMEKELINSLDRLKSAEAEKQKYIMGVVHEIKTPLSALQSYLDIILEKYLGPLDEKVEEKLKRSRVRSQEAISLIDDILRISRIKLIDELNLAKINIGEMICLLTDKQSVNLQKKNIQVDINNRSNNQAVIQGDRLLLEIAFSNLLGNAVKYTGESGSIEIEISGTKDAVTVTVSDSGVGIPADELENIFDDFYRASNIKHKDYNGTGMGLSIVKQIVTYHKGKVTVKSPSKLQTSSNPGTEVSVTLPSTF